MELEEVIAVSAGLSVTFTSVQGAKSICRFGTMAWACWPVVPAR